MYQINEEITFKKKKKSDEVMKSLRQTIMWKWY